MISLITIPLMIITKAGHDRPADALGRVATPRSPDSSTHDDRLAGCVDDLELTPATTATTSTSPRSSRVPAASPIDWEPCASADGCAAFMRRSGTTPREIRAASRSIWSPASVPTSNSAARHDEVGTASAERWVRDHIIANIPGSGHAPSDLLRSEVVDTDDNRYGTVEDVLLVQDGPLMLPFGASFRVDRLIVGTRKVGTRLGYNREASLVHGFSARSSGAQRRAYEVPWESVVNWDGQTIRVRAAAFRENSPGPCGERVMNEISASETAPATVPGFGPARRVAVRR